MDRSSKAALSPQEMASPRRLRGNPRHPIVSGHRHLLLSMHLIAAEADDLKITDVGRDRLAKDEADAAASDRRRGAPTPD